ncbi:MAG: hypothetical protein AAF547_01080 [Actinomycetota bacterium]
MSNKVRIILLYAAIGLGIATVFNVVHEATGGAWLVSLPAVAVAGLAARAIYWWSIGQQTNDGEVVATEHGPDGRVEAIEVFWRPG